MEAIQGGASERQSPHVHWAQGASAEVVASVAMVLAYVALDYATFAHGILRNGFAPWNPATGFVLAFLVLRGARGLPFFALAAILAEFLVRDRDAVFAAFALAAVTFIVIGAGALALRALGAHAARRVTLRGTALFIAAALGTCALYAALYTSIASAVGIALQADWLTAASDFGAAELLGVLLLTPVLLVGRMYLRQRALRAFVPNAETIAMALSVPATLAVLWSVSDPHPRRFFYILFLPLIWIAVRKGLLGAVLAVLGSQLLIIFALYVLKLPPPVMLNLQLLLIVLAITSMFLGASATETQAADARREAREAELRTIFDTAPSALLMLDDEGRVKSANPAAVRLFGLTDRALIGRSLSDLVPGLDFAAALGGMVETIGMRANGEPCPIELWLGRDAGARAPYVAVIRDLIARREMEARFARQQANLERTMRMAAVSEMAQALAHELNQPLSAATSYIRACNRLLLSGNAADDPRFATAVDGATREMTRASDIVRRLRDFFRTGAGELERSRLDEVVADALRPLRERLKSANVEVVTRFAPAMPELLIDRMQVGAVFQNLVNNSIDALIANASAARRIEITGEVVRRGLVRILVADNGPGIAAGLRPNLFDPFSTTKAEGLGLGLALSRALIEGQGGTLQLEGADGHAIFSIHLPVREVEPASAG